MKKQLKKSLSLFLAVLMMLSCWVWIAPEKAEAAANSYDVTVYHNVVNGAEEVSVTIWYKPDNGRGTEASKTYNIPAGTVDGGDPSTTIEGVPGWPTKVQFYVKNDASDYTWGSCKCEITFTGISINGQRVLTCNGPFNWSQSAWTNGYRTRTYYPTNDAGTAGTAERKDGDADTSYSFNWPKPYFVEATALTTADITVSKLPNGAETTANISVSAGKDNYGVDWTATMPTLSDVSYVLKYTSGASEAVLGSTYGKIEGTSNTAKVTIYDEVQTLFPNASTGRVFAYATYNNKTTKSANINLTFPTYDITFDANGGKIGSSDSDAQDTVKNEGIKYDGNIGKSPAYRAKAGFTFDGFYSVQNPDATGLNASFSGTKFEDNGTKVDKDGDKTYYAAWKATPITAKFITADNQLIGEVEGRYNNYYTAENMYNGLAGLNAAVKASHTAGKVQFNSNNEPIYKDGSTTYTFAGWKIIEAYDERLVDGNEDTVLDGDFKLFDGYRDENGNIRNVVTFQAVYTKADAAKYTVTFEDGSGKTLSSKSDYLYRDQVTNVPDTDPTKANDERYSYEFIGWAKKLAGVNYFAVDQYDCDIDGVKLAYTSKDAAEFIVKGNATYIPVFRMIDLEYGVIYTYKVDGGKTSNIRIDGYHWEDNPRMPEIKDNYTHGGYRYFLLGWTVGTDSTVKQLDEIEVKGLTRLTAVYGNEILAEYTINFYGKAEDGETDVLLNGDNNIYEHNSTVTAPEVAQNIDTAESLYTFAGWSPSVNKTASGDVDYYATYTKKDYADLYFYNYDGTLIYSLDGKENTLFVGDAIPEYSNIDKDTNENVLPTKEEDVVGTYNFIGWKDGSGNDIVPGTSKFEGDTHLYAQFETVYKEYTVEFLNDVVDEDGKNVVVSTNKYHYGEEIEIPADPTKAPDESFTYTFKAWTPDISEICYGDATYTATYRREYNYYDVTWLDDTGALYQTNSYVYGAKIQPAVIDEPRGYDEAKPGHYWVLKHWAQCDENGTPLRDIATLQPIIFTRGDKMPAEDIYFYPVFEEVAAKYTVTFKDENGAVIGTAEVSDGADINDYTGHLAEDLYKAPDDTYHHVVDQWVNVEDNTVVVYIHNDVTVKPTYKSVEHTDGEPVIVLAPTCTETGLADIPCTEPACDYVKKNVVQDIVPDESKPTGQIYVGSDLWTFKNYDDGIDYNDVKYINPKTTLIVNSEDTGSRSMPWNLDAKLNRGVAKIEYYVSEIGSDGILVDPGLVMAESWTEIYNRDQITAEILGSVLSEKGMTLEAYNKLHESAAGTEQKKAIDAEVAAIQAGYNVNVTGISSNLKVEGKNNALENGKQYIIYIKISDVDPDKSGAKYGSNVCYFSSGTIHYGTTAPTIAITGEGYGTKFCAEATISVTDDSDGFKAYIDGEEITLTDGNYKATAAGLHTVIAVDANGNKTTKTYEIKGNHSYRNYTTLASCTENGSRYDLCELCGAKANETVIPAKGHSFRDNYIETAPTCVADGSRVYVCENNCGANLVLEFGENGLDADKLAQAEKYVEPAEGETEGKWVSLTANDLKHLKATGVHTYAKVKDEDGNDTDEDVWVIDKVPTCSAVGSKHKDCIKCGLEDARVTVVIPVDDTAHKFYRVKTTLEPTCTEKGEKTKTCRYCGDVEHVEYIDALGHIAGEYQVVSPATCEGKGSKILLCGRCNVPVGELKDGKFTGEVVEIPALGHAWKLDGEIWQATAETADADKGIEEGKWYQSYICRNDATHTKTEEVEGYQPPVAATVTFNFNGGSYVIPAVGNENEVGYVPPMLKGTQTVSAYVGDFIAFDEVETAIKQNNATYTYTFSYWATKNADGTYTEVKFPIEVKGDATYYAVYAEKYVNYTITYYTETVNALGGIDVIEYSKIGYRHNGEEVTLADGPKMTNDWQYTYTFAGWKVKGSDPAVVYTDKVTIDGANINLVATYTKKTNVYGVTYAYSSSNQIESFTVNAGEAARACAIGTPEKAYDSKYHYTFEAWNKAAQLANVQSNIFTTPNFKAVKHNCVVDTTATVQPTCTEDGVLTYKCECGYSYTKTGDKALGHQYGTPVTVDGVTTRTCTRCGEPTEEGIKFDVTFYGADLESVYTTSKNVVYGTLVSTILPTSPVKPSTTVYEYEFNYWATKSVNDAGEAVYTKIADDLAVTEALELYPVYKDGTKRTYTVTFISEGTVIYTVVVEAGASATCTEPTKNYDSNYHYTFNGWNYAEELKAVYRDITATAEFTQTAHSYTASLDTAATCKTNRIDKYTCTCGYSYTAEVADSTLDHVMVKGETVDGVTTYKCSREGCDYTTTEVADYTITYYVDGKAYTSTTATHGDKLLDKLTDKIPSKATDATNTYEFDCWMIETAEGNVAITDETTVTGNMKLVAKFTETARKYTVVFAYDASNVLKTVADVAYGNISAALYDVAVDGTPVKKYDNNYHYTFSEFKFEKTDNSGSTYFYYADFSKAEHTLVIDTANSTNATCTEGASTIKKCTACEYVEKLPTGKPLGHKEILSKDSVAAEQGKDGVNIYVCSVCGVETRRETVKWQDPESGYVTIKITVKDTDGNKIQGAKVDLYSGSNHVATNYTGVGGTAEFKVAKGEYKVIISGIKNAGSVEFTAKADKDGEIQGVPSVSISKCGCACHNTGIWGTIFRFFHKIIKMITGEFKCCKDPSDLY